MKTSRSRQTLLVLAIGLGLTLGAHPVGATSLHLQFVDTDGSPVQVSKAELLLVAWGMREERVELEPSVSGLTLHMEGEWLRSRWPLSSPSLPARNRFDDHMGVYLYLEAPLLAPIQSHRFESPGRPDDATDKARTTTITFPRGQEAVVPEGQDVRMTLVFRPRVPRRVRFVNPGGEPWSGLKVHASMFWSSANHCAVVTGSESLGGHVTDRAGWIELPDGEFEYLLEVASGARRFHGPLADKSPMPWRLVSRLQETHELVVRELAIEPLDMRVRRNGEPAVGLYLGAMLADCFCGACHGPLGTTDERGRISRDDFRPEKMDEIWLVDGDKGEVWRSASRGGLIEIDL